MKIVQINDVPFRDDGPTTRVLNDKRNKAILSPELLGRDPNRLDNFHFGITWIGSKGGFYTPRHRHDFSQWRYMIEGEADYHVGEPQTAGVLNLSPEGAYYGPQEDGVGIVVTCQFGDASGNGYNTREQYRAGLAEMKKRNEGVFEDGLYKRNPGVPGLPVQDANEALFEFIRGRPMIYPPTGYMHTILVNSNGIPWMPVDCAPGISEKDMGTYGLCRYRAAQYKLEPGSEFVVKGRGIYFVLSGKGAVESESYEEHTTIYLEEDEQATFTASEVSIVLFLGMPTQGEIEKVSGAVQQLQAEQAASQSVSA